MANTTDWGRVYCFTEFGDEAYTIANALITEVLPACFVTPTAGVVDSLAFSIDKTTEKIDSIDIKVDQTLL